MRRLPPTKPLESEVPILFHIHSHHPGILSVVKRPRPHPWLRDDLRKLCEEGVTDIVSLLPEVDDQVLGLEKEADEAHRLGINFHRIPIEDCNVPHSHLEWLDAIAPLLHRLRSGHHLATHCRGSIGRATLFAASILLCEGKSAEAALHIIEEARGRKVPDTEEQVQWVHQLELILKTHRPQLLRPD